MAEVKILMMVKSGNQKVGNLSQTYSSECTCPTRCPFKHNGCYGENFRCKHNWARVDKEGLTPTELATKVATSKCSKVIRHNVCGDIAKFSTSTIDTSLVEALCKAYQNHIAYTYTHCELSEENIQAVRNAMAKGFIINFSTESVEDAKRCVNSGCNAVITVASMSKPRIEIDGVKIQQCPSTFIDGIQCKNCGLCWRANRKTVIAFPIHGNCKGKAIKSKVISEI